MAAFALTDTSIYVGALDASCFGDTVALDAAGETVDVTTFCSGGWRQYVPGLRQWAGTWGGPQDLAATTAANTNTPDEVYLLTAGDGTAYPVTMVPAGAAEGSVAYGSRALLSSYTPLTGTVGARANHSIAAGPYLNTPLVRGVLATKQTVTANGNGTGHLLGAVAAGQFVWCGVHFLTAGGTTPTLTVILESDDNAGFTSATTRATFTAQTTRGGQWASVAGAITDTYWRLRFASIGGTSPSFQLRGFIGIL